MLNLKNNVETSLYYNMIIIIIYSILLQHLHHSVHNSRQINSPLSHLRCVFICSCGIQDAY